MFSTYQTCLSVFSTPVEQFQCVLLTDLLIVTCIVITVGCSSPKLGPFSAECFINLEQKLVSAPRSLLAFITAKIHPVLLFFPLEIICPTAFLPVRDVCYHLCLVSFLLFLLFIFCKIRGIILKSEKLQHCLHVLRAKKEN